MSEEKNNLCTCLLVCQDMALANAVSKTLKSQFVLNENSATYPDDVNNFITRLDIDLIVLEHAAHLPDINAVVQMLRKADKQVPIIVVNRDGKILAGEFIRRGAFAVCPPNDLVELLQQALHAMNISRSDRSREQSSKALEINKQNFKDLYSALADPICFVQDGLFMDANAAFMREFEVERKEDLNELTILNFVPRKSEREFKNLLKKGSIQNLSANPILFNLQTKAQRELDMHVSARPIVFKGENAVMLYFRSTASGSAVSATSFDNTTGLPGKSQFLIYYREQAHGNDEIKGYLTYLLINNYRDVWMQDGYNEAEKFIRACSTVAKRHLPPKTEIFRFTDDGLMLYVTDDDKERVIEGTRELIKNLDQTIPEGMGKLTNPECYAGMYEILGKTPVDEAITRSFRSARALINNQLGERVAEPMSGSVSRKDERRLNELNEIIEAERLKLLYQPITSLEADGQPRYRERLQFFSEANELLEAGPLIQIAERYQVMRQIDRWKIGRILQDMLTGHQSENTHMYISISSDAVSDAEFAPWVMEQIRQTGIKGQNFIFEFSFDVMNNTFSDAQNFMKELAKINARFALSRITRIDEAVEKILNYFKPDVIKLDMREIDTYEDEEEIKIMTALKKYSDDNNIFLIAEYMESPAQLSRIWPYDIKYIQGDGMIPPLEKMIYNFNESLF